MTDPSAQLLRHLKENEDLTRHLLEAMPGGVVHVGLDGAIHFANGEAQRLLGLSHDALAQRFVVDFAPLTWFENGQPCPVEDYPVSRCLATGEPQRDVTIGVQLPHGDMSWAVFSAVPLRDPATGQQTGALVTFLDITHRIATEKKLAASEAQYRRIVDTATEGITTMDPDLRITFVNKRMCELVGYTADELIGRDAREIALPTRRDKAEHRASQLRNGESLLVEAPVRHKQGHEVWLLIAATPILDPDGSHAGVLTMCADLTSHKQMEAALRDAEKMRAVGQLAGGVAHDFNNQLTAIRGFAELLLEMLDEASVEATHARTIIRAASRAGSLTHQLLAFARRGKYQHVTVDLHELIDELIVLLQRSIGPEVRIRRQSAPGAAFTIGDPDQLHNALLNISLNARDAMPGGGDLTFRTRTIGIESGDARLGGPSGVPSEQLPPGPYIEIDIADTGIGMDTSTAERCFEPFFSTKGTSGTGMGLAAAWGTVTNHRGALRVESTPGVGTTFRVWLPLAAETRPAGADGARSGSRSPVPGSAHVLVIDDEPMVREFARQSLGALGYRVTLMNDGASALAWLGTADARATPPAVALLDMRMPGMSGRDTWEQLRELAPALPVILVSGHSLDGDAQRLLDDGVRAFIQKPFSIAHLSQVMSGVLSERS